MNVFSKIAAGAVLVVALTAVFVGGAAAAGQAPKGMSTQAYQALLERSQALNRAYHVGSVDPATRALELRGQALNREYGLGSAATPRTVAPNALRMRSEAMNAKYQLGSYSVVRPAPSFNWADAGLGAAGMLGIVLIAGALLFGTQRFRGARAATLHTT